MKKLKKFAITAAAYFLPLAVFAQNTANDNLVDLFNQINTVINAIIPFLVGLAVLIIIWGVFNYIAGAGDEEKRAQAKQYIVWGVVGVFIMLSVWGLVNVLVNSFALRKGPLDVGDLPNFGPNTLQPGGVGGGGGGCVNGFLPDGITPC